MHAPLPLRVGARQAAWTALLVAALAWPVTTHAQEAQVQAAPAAESSASAPAPGSSVAPDLSAQELEAVEAGADPGLHGDDGGDEGDNAYLEASTQPISREEARTEEERRLDEEAEQLPPPPPPEWRLRAGVGVALPLNGASSPFLRLHQEIEWQPTVIAPFLFGLGGAEYLLGGTLGQADARIGMTAFFCEDAIVRCQAAVAFVVGAFFGQNLLAFDVGGEGDVRFLFGALELSIRLGFGGGGGLNVLHGSGGIGAAF